MKIRYITFLFCSVLMMSGCSYTTQHYNKTSQTFTVLASDENSNQSEQKAYQMAESICEEKNQQLKVIKLYRTPNTIKSITVQGKQVYLSKDYQANDQLTAIEGRCVLPKPVSKK